MTARRALFRVCYVGVPFAVGRRGDSHHAPPPVFADPPLSEAGPMPTSTRIRALEARGLRAISSAEAFMTPRFCSLPIGTAPHAQGKPGGQAHPPVEAS